MRIRKLAKLSSLLNATETSSFPQVHVCEFNQSPWDIITDFSPPSSPMFPHFTQVNGNGNGNGLSAMNERSGRSVSIMEWEGCGDDVIGKEFDFTEKSVGRRESVVLCGKTDGKSWQCKREARYDNSLCEHHLALASKNSSSNQSSEKKKKSAVVVETESGKRKVRNKKPKTSAANPYEIYYYSGFGPRWGKRRGEDNGCDNNLSKKSLEHEHVKEPSSAMDEDVDYIDEGDEDEEEDGLSKRKRARKPVKARSLKSLM